MKQNISIGQPPFTDPAQVEWLTRFVLNVTAAIESSVDFTPVGQLPTKLENGMCRYFSVAIAPDITQPGPWMYVEGVWTYLG